MRLYISKRTVAHGVTLLYALYILVRRLLAIKSLSYFVWFLPTYISLVLQGYYLIVSLKKEPKEKDDSLGIFLVALLSANFPVIVSKVCNIFPIFNYKIYLASIAYIVNFLVMIFYVYAIMSLGKSLTVLPEYNEIKTTGAYKYSKHPLYLSYIIQYIMQILIFQTYSVVLCSIIQITLMIVRARYEERVLSENDEIYKNYLQNTRWINLNLGGKRK